MKQIKSLLLVLAFTVIGVSSNAQFHINGEAGVSSLRGSSFVAGLSIGYDFGLVNIEAGYLAHLSQAVAKPSIFNVKIGHSILISDETQLIPSIGLAYNLRSTDNKSLNTKSLIYSLYYVKEIRSDADWLIGLNYTERTFIATVGLRFNLRKDE